MTVVADSTPLIYLASLSRFEVLRSLFAEVVIPESVHREVIIQASGFPVRDCVQAALGVWITVRSVSEPAALPQLMPEGRIHRAEAVAIALAGEIGARWLLMDDRRAVEQARGMGLSILRTPMILALAARSSTVPDLRRCLEQMREAGFWLSDAHLAAILEAVGETK